MLYRIEEMMPPCGTPALITAKLEYADLKLT